jgi:plasmid stabilization system protein ParE
VTYRVRFTKEAEKELDRLYAFLADEDPGAAREAMTAIAQALTILERFPFSCRKAANGRYGTFLRELIVPFGSSGYVLLFKITDERTVTVAAARHQRECDFY